MSAPQTSKRHLNRGLALHATIEELCCEVGAADSTPSTSGDPAKALRERSSEVFEEQWAAHVSPRDYASTAQREWDRQLCWEALTDYLSEGSDGPLHIQNSVAVEYDLSFEYQGVPLRGRVDNIVELDDHVLIVDYKGSLSSQITGYTAQDITPHLEGEAYRPGRMRSAMQAAVYIEGVKRSPLVEEGAAVEFEYYGLLHDSGEASTPEGLQPTASGRSRRITGIYEEHQDAIWEMIRTYHERIASQEFAPAPWELLREEACEECIHQPMCADHLSEEVRRDV